MGKISDLFSVLSWKQHKSELKAIPGLVGKSERGNMKRSSSIVKSTVRKWDHRQQHNTGKGNGPQKMRRVPHWSDSCCSDQKVLSSQARKVVHVLLLRVLNYSQSIGSSKPSRNLKSSTEMHLTDLLASKRITPILTRPFLCAQLRKRWLKCRQKVLWESSQSLPKAVNSATERV